MQGVSLKNLSAPDLLDVLHYMYEVDFSSTTVELMEARDKARILIYEELYEQEYPYSSSPAPERMPDDGPLSYDDDDIPVPLDPTKHSSRPKSYVPPTKFNPDAVNPYNGVLDAPLG